jgi:hypothetical protein
LARHFTQRMLFNFWNAAFVPTCEKKFRALRSEGKASELWFLPHPHLLLVSFGHFQGRRRKIERSGRCIGRLRGASRLDDWGRQSRRGSSKLLRAFVCHS